MNRIIKIDKLRARMHKDEKERMGVSWDKYISNLDSPNQYECICTCYIYFNETEWLEIVKDKTLFQTCVEENPLIQIYAQIAQLYNEIENLKMSTYSNEHRTQFVEDQLLETNSAVQHIKSSLCTLGNSF